MGRSWHHRGQIVELPDGSTAVLKVIRKKPSKRDRRIQRTQEAIIARWCQWYYGQLLGEA